jgi:excisionase family DNA binding protein
MEKELLTAKETAEFLGLAEITIYKMTYRKQIPYVKLGRTKRFDKSKLLAWIETNAHDTIKKSK